MPGAAFRERPYTCACTRSSQAVEPGGALSASSLYPYNKAKNKNWAVGGIYHGASFSATHAKGLHDAQFKGRWQDSTAIIGWRASDEAVETKLRIAKDEKDDKKRNDLEALLLPLRTLYAGYKQRCDHAGAEALEAALLRALRTRPRRAEQEGST